MATSKLNIIPYKSENLTILNTQSNYINVDFPLSYVKWGEIVWVKVTIKVLSEYTTHPGIKCFEGLPNSIAEFFVSFTPTDAAQKPLRCKIDTSGNMYIRYGYNNKFYDVNFVYFTND